MLTPTSFPSPWSSTRPSTICPSSCVSPKKDSFSSLRTTPDNPPWYVSRRCHILQTYYYHTFGTVRTHEPMGRYMLSLLRIADLLDKNRINMVRVLLEATQFGSIFNCAPEALDMLAKDRLRIVLAQQHSIWLVDKSQCRYVEHSVTAHVGNARKGPTGLAPAQHQLPKS